MQALPTVVMAKPVADQVIVIAGASSGIGLATAALAARCGAKVVLAARNRHDLERAADAIRRDGGDAIALAADLTSFDDVQQLVETTVERHGRIDTFVAAAGVAVYGAFAQIPLADFRRAMDVDFFGHVNAAKVVLPHLERSAGAFISIGSILSERGFPLQSAYCAAKHALRGWLESLRTELEHEGSNVRVTLVKPSPINTPLFEKAKTYLGVEPKAIPPVYEPELVARAILRAAEGNQREVAVGGVAKVLALGQRLSPKLVDLTLRPWSWAFSAQQTSRPKAADSPNNLYAPVDDDGGMRGRADERATASSIYRRAAVYTLATAVACTTALGIAAVVMRRLRS